MTTVHHNFCDTKHTSLLPREDVDLFAYAALGVQLKNEGILLDQSGHGAMGRKDTSEVAFMEF